MSTVGVRLAEQERRTNQHDADIKHIYVELTDHGRELRDHGRELRDQRRLLQDHGRLLQDHGRQLEDHGHQLRDHGRLLQWLTTVVSSMAVPMGLTPPPLPQPEPMAEGEEE